VVVIDAVQRVGNLPQQLHIDGIAVPEIPFFVMLLLRSPSSEGTSRRATTGPLLRTCCDGFLRPIASSTLRYLARLGFCPFLLPFSCFINRYRSQRPDAIRRTYSTKGFRVSRGSVRRGMKSIAVVMRKVKRASCFTNPYKGLRQYLSARTRRPALLFGLLERLDERRHHLEESPTMP